VRAAEDFLESLHHRTRFLASLIPALTAALLVLISNMPVSFTGELLPSPALALAGVYFWVLVRADLMPPPVVLLIGLLEDLLSGGPPGLWAAGYLAAYWLTAKQRETLAGLNGAGALVGFTGAMLLAAATAYGLSAAVYLRLAPLPPLLLESVSTVALYPVVAFCMAWIMRKTVGPETGDDA